MLFIFQTTLPMFPIACNHLYERVFSPLCVPPNSLSLTSTELFTGATIISSIIKVSIEKINRAKFTLFLFSGVKNEFYVKIQSIILHSLFSSSSHVFDFLSPPPLLRSSFPPTLSFMAA